jgi:hypothetical protein
MNKSMITRRHFLLTAAATLAAIRLSAANSDKRPPRIVLRSSWQTVNIGDIGHTPGVLALLEKYLPEAEVTLWPSDIGFGVEEMLRSRFPKLRITKDQTEAFSNDFLLHGSGPSLVARNHVEAWKNQTGKPYGIYGITMPDAADPGIKFWGNIGLDDRTKRLLDGAAFVFLRDGASLQVVKNAGVKSPIIEFGPDGAFAADVLNDVAATNFLRQHNLEDGGFICFLPHLRFDPMWRFKPHVLFNENKHRRNELMKERDHAPLREAIIAIVRQTRMKVLVVPENITQMETGKELLVDPLPEDVKTKVVWRKDFWNTDEALSTYRRSAGLVSLEMHSPIMALGQGIPAIVCRFAEQTSKGIMWRDIGLGDWLFDFDQPEDLVRVVPAALALAKDPAAAKEKAAKALAFVQQRQRETMHILRRSIGL